MDIHNTESNVQLNFIKKVKKKVKPKDEAAVTSRVYLTELSFSLQTPETLTQLTFLT